MDQKEQVLRELKGEVADLKEQYQNAQTKVRKLARGNRENIRNKGRQATSRTVRQPDRRENDQVQAGGNFIANPTIYRGHYTFPYISLYLDIPPPPSRSLAACDVICSTVSDLHGTQTTDNDDNRNTRQNETLFQNKTQIF